MSYTICLCGQIPDRNNLKEELVLAHCFRGLQLPAGEMEWGQQLSLCWWEHRVIAQW